MTGAAGSTLPGEDAGLYALGFINHDNQQCFMVTPPSIKYSEWYAPRSATVEDSAGGADAGGAVK